MEKQFFFGQPCYLFAPKMLVQACVSLSGCRSGEDKSGDPDAEDAEKASTPERTTPSSTRSRRDVSRRGGGSTDRSGEAGATSRERRAGPRDRDRSAERKPPGVRRSSAKMKVSSRKSSMSTAGVSAAPSPPPLLPGGAQTPTSDTDNRSVPSMFHHNNPSEIQLQLFLDNIFVAEVVTQMLKL